MPTGLRTSLTRYSLALETEATRIREADPAAEQIFGAFIYLALLEVRWKFLFVPFRRSETPVRQRNHHLRYLVHYVNVAVGLDGYGLDAVTLG